MKNKRIFAFEYIDWCKKNKNPKTVEDTERLDWICEFYQSEEWNREDVNGLDIYICMGGEHDKSNS